jgi:hypothetical protein
VTRKCTGHFAEMENILIVGVHAQTQRHVPLKLMGVQATPLSFRCYLYFFSGCKIGGSYFFGSFSVIWECNPKL